MSLSLVLRPDAQADLLEYERQQVGLGKAFSESVEEALSLIEAMPQMYATVFHDVRRGKLRRFPYVVYYRILPFGSNRSSRCAALESRS